MFFGNGESALIVTFLKYTLSKLYSHCNQNFNFYYFFGDYNLFVQYLFRFVYLFSPKTSKNDSRNHSLKRFWTAYDTFYHLVYIIFPFNSMTWFYAEVTATKVIMKHQLVLQVFYSVTSVYILDVRHYEKLIFTLPLKINNKCGFRLANRFAQGKFWKFFITKDN